MKISTITYTSLALTTLFAFSEAGCNKKVDVEVCVKTDNYPHETSLTIEDDGSDIRLEMDGFSKSGKTYCDDVRLCPGRHYLLIEDEDCDGFSHNYGEVVMRTRNDKIMDKSLGNFGCNYGWRRFEVPNDTGSNSNTCHGSNCNGNPQPGNGPFGTSNCRACKDKCANKYKGSLWDIKRCKTDRCRAHFGKKTCKD